MFKINLRIFIIKQVFFPQLYTHKNVTFFSNHEVKIHFLCYFSLALADYISSSFCELIYCLRVEGILFFGFWKSYFPFLHARKKILKYSRITHASKFVEGEIFQTGNWGLAYQSYSKTNRVCFGNKTRVWFFVFVFFCLFCSFILPEDKEGILK